jgi:hypothetical protein
MTPKSVPDLKGLSDAELRIAAEVAMEMAQEATQPFDAHTTALTFARAALKDANFKRTLAARHRSIIASRVAAAEAASLDGPTTALNELTAGEPSCVKESPPARIDAAADDARAAQQALAASLTEIINDVLRSRRFAVRAVNVS